MGNSSGSGNADLKAENTRAGGADDSRTASQPGDANAAADETRAGGPDDSRGEGGREGASPEERDNIPRGAPEDSRSATR